MARTNKAQVVPPRFPDEGENAFMALFSCWSRLAGAICEPLTTPRDGDDFMHALDLIVLAAPRDAEVAHAIYKELARMGFRALVECERVTGKLSAAQQQTMSRARMVLFLISPATASSYFCSQELAFILSTKKPLVPLYLCPPERIQLTPDLAHRFSSFPSFLLYEDYHDCQARLIAYLAVTLYGRRKPVDPELAAGSEEAAAAVAAAAAAANIGPDGIALPPVKHEKLKLDRGEIRRLRKDPGQAPPALPPREGGFGVTSVPGTPMPQGPGPLAGTPMPSPHNSFSGPRRGEPPLRVVHITSDGGARESPPPPSADAAAGGRLSGEAAALARPTFSSLYLVPNDGQPIGEARYDAASFPHCE